MAELSVKILEANAGDCREILAIQHSAFAEEASRYAPDCAMEPMKETLAQIVQAYKTHTILKAEIGGKIAGAVRFLADGKVCKIGRLCVRPEFRGRGVGSMLLKACEDIAAHTCDVCELFTGHKSLDNQRLYQKLGYKIAGEKQISKNLRFIFMQKKLR